MISASGAFAARTQRMVAPGDNFSKPALAAVSPIRECVRLSNLKFRVQKFRVRLHQTNPIESGKPLSAAARRRFFMR